MLSSSRGKGTQLQRFECFRPVSDLPYAIIIPDMVLVVEAPVHWLIVVVVVLVVVGSSSSNSSSSRNINSSSSGSGSSSRSSSSGSSSSTSK